MDENFDLRRQLFGDALIGVENLQMIETARSVGGRLCLLVFAENIMVHWCATLDAQP